MNRVETVALIKQRRAELEAIKAELKTEFFGLDLIIDRVIKSVQTWYLLPEILTFPVIINLWGLTGVGKTQLVRSLVKKLNYQNKFVEIQMDGFSIGSGYYQDSICSILQTSSIEEGDTGIVLLDEFQRFRTIELDQRGDCKELEVKRYQDIWMLLSDGKFPADYSLHTKIEREILFDAYYADQGKENQEAELSEEVTPDDAVGVTSSGNVASDNSSSKPRKQKKKKKPIIKQFALSPYQASDYKKLLKLKEPVAEIMTWDLQKINFLCQVALASRKSSEFDYSKLLIFICGNLDEAFRGASSSIDDCDTDADIFHEQTKRVSVIDIKKALQERFRPEQIARMGNTHIIYPSLSKKSYEQIIEATAKKYTNKLDEKIGIQFDLQPSVYQEVYDNAVFPTQGTRPVFSSTHQILSSPLVDMTIWAVENEIGDLTVEMDGAKNIIRGEKDGKIIELPVQLDIRNQRSTNTKDFNTLVAVHEAGHALVYAVLNHCAPQEIKINLASFKGGYNVFHEEELKNKEILTNYIAALLGGTVAEELIFGDAGKSNGCENDIEKATMIAAKFIKAWGFDDYVAAVRVASHQEWADTDYKDANVKIRVLMINEKRRALETITTHMELFNKIVNKLIANETIKPDEFIELAAPYIDIVKPSIDESITPYSRLWQEHSNQPRQGEKNAPI